MLEIDLLGLSLGGRRILEDVSFTCRPGTLTLVTGPNGAGKTSLLRCLAGLERHESGVIRLDGQEADVDSELWKSSVALVPDDNALLDELTVLEHLRLGCVLAGLSRAEAQERLEPLLGLFDLERYRDHSSAELSFGYRKRLAIALSLVHPARIYLLDEPLVGLDATCLDVFRELLVLLRSRARIVVVASHITEPLRSIADRSLIIRDGRAASDEAAARPPPRPPPELPWLR